MIFCSDVDVVEGYISHFSILCTLPPTPLPSIPSTTYKSSSTSKESTLVHLFLSGEATTTPIPLALNNNEDLDAIDIDSPTIVVPFPIGLSILIPPDSHVPEICHPYQLTDGRED